MGSCLRMIAIGQGIPKIRDDGRHCLPYSREAVMKAARCESSYVRHVPLAFLQLETRKQYAESRARAFGSN